eukprot:6398090-Prymnesium_polylepis.1
MTAACGAQCSVAIQSAALSLFANESAEFQSDLEYLHVPTRTRISNGTEVGFVADAVVNSHFRHLVSTNTT